MEEGCRRVRERGKSTSFGLRPVSTRTTSAGQFVERPIWREVEFAETPRSAKCLTNSGSDPVAGIIKPLKSRNDLSAKECAADETSISHSLPSAVLADRGDMVGSINFARKADIG